MKNPCSCKWYATTRVTVHAMWSFFCDWLYFATCPRWLQGLQLHVSITTKILSFATKIVIIYFQFSSNVSNHSEAFLENTLETMQNLILATKCNPKSLNPNWIHADRTLTIHKTTWIILVMPCLGCEHLGLLGWRLDKGWWPNCYKG
jgi:hypothetical protein